MAVAYFIGGSQDLSKRCVEKALNEVMVSVVDRIVPAVCLNGLPNDAPVPSRVERYHLRGCVGHTRGGEEILIYVVEFKSWL